MATAAEFDAFVSAERKNLVAWLYLRTPDWHAAEDVAEAAMLMVWQHLPHIRGRIKPYVWTAAHNAMVDLYRYNGRKVRTVPLDDARAVPDPCDMAETLAGRIDDQATLAGAFARMTPATRACWQLRLEGWEYPQISARLRIPKGTVKSRLNFAKDAIRRGHAPIGRTRSA